MTNTKFEHKHFSKSNTSLSDQKQENNTNNEYSDMRNLSYTLNKDDNTFTDNVVHENRSKNLRMSPILGPANNHNRQNFTTSNTAKKSLRKKYQIKSLRKQRNDNSTVLKSQIKNEISNFNAGRSITCLVNNNLLKSTEKSKSEYKKSFNNINDDNVEVNEDNMCEMREVKSCVINCGVSDEVSSSERDIEVMECNEKY